MTSRSTELNNYFKLKTKNKLISADIMFLKDCKIHSVFEKFMKVKTSTNCKISESIIKFAKNKWLKSEIKNFYANRNKLEIKAYNLHLKLTKNLNNFEFIDWSVFENKMYDVINHKFLNKLKSQNNKFKQLIPKNMELKSTS